MVHLLLGVRRRAEQLRLPLPAVYDIRRLKPLDAVALDGVLRRFPLVAVAEESYLAGGVGEAVATFHAEGGYPALLRRFGVPDVCVPHATSEEQRDLYGLTVENVIATCAPLLDALRPPQWEDHGPLLARTFGEG